MTGWRPLADEALEQTIGSLLDQRRPEVSICAFEAAGEVQVTQGGEVVDVATARGPVRVRRPR